MRCTLFSFVPNKLNNNQNRHSEGGTTAETLSNYLKIPRCALDDVNMGTTTTTDDFLKKERHSFFFHTIQPE